MRESLNMIKALKSLNLISQRRWKNLAGGLRCVAAESSTGNNRPAANQQPPPQQRLWTEKGQRSFTPIGHKTFFSVEEGASSVNSSKDRVLSTVRLFNLTRWPWTHHSDSVEFKQDCWVCVILTYVRSPGAVFICLVSCCQSLKA